MISLEIGQRRKQCTFRSHFVLIVLFLFSSEKFSLIGQSLDHGAQIIQGDTMYLSEVYKNKDILIYSDAEEFLVDSLGLQINPAMIFAKNVPTADGSTRDLKLEWYLPQPKFAKDDKHGLRPMLVWLPAGALADSMDNDKANAAADFALSYARRGYVAVIVKYQFPNVSLLRDTSGNCNINIQEMKKAIYRMALNIRTAIRFAGAYADTLGIDLSNIIVGGRSVGAVGAIAGTFLDEGDQHQWLIDSVGSINAIPPRLVNGLGSKPLKESEYQIKALIAKSGGLTNPNYLNNNIPWLMLHGTCDELIAFDQGWPKDCDQPQTPTGMKQQPDDAFKFYGPWYIADFYDRFAAKFDKDVYYELAISCNVGHSFPSIPKQSNDIILRSYIDPFLYRIVSNQYIGKKSKRFRMDYPKELRRNEDRCKATNFTTSECYFDTIPASVLSFDFDEQVNFYPNPIVDFFYINCEGSSCAKEIRVLDILGREIDLRIDRTNSGLLHVQFEQGAHSGLYFVLIGEKLVGKIIRE